MGILVGLSEDGLSYEFYDEECACDFYKFRSSRWRFSNDFLSCKSASFFSYSTVICCPLSALESTPLISACGFILVAALFRARKMRTIIVQLLDIDSPNELGD